MTKKILSSILCILILCTLSSTIFARDYGFNIDTLANAIYLVNIDTGEVIYEKNADVQVHPASTTKIMSAALAMELCPDLKNTMVTVPDDVWAEFDGLNVSTAGLKGGEILSMYDLICGMMLPSGNEAASAVRDYFGGDEFIVLMNQKAVELGCTNTNFNDPHGVFIAGHYSTAKDLALITEWAMSVPGFWEISQMARYTKPASNKNEEVTLASSVLMQDPNSGYYTPYIKGIKTGTTDESGRCLVSAAQKDGMTYLLVVLGGSFEPDQRFWESGQSAFTETRLIYDWAFANLHLKNISDTDTIVAEITLKHASKRDTLLLYPSDELFTVLNKTSETEPVITYSLVDVPELVKAPIALGQVIGKADVLVDGEVVGQVDLVSREEIELDRFVLLMDSISIILSSKAAKIVYAVLFVLVAIYLYYVLVIIPSAQKSRRRKNRQNYNSSTNHKNRRR